MRKGFFARLSLTNIRKNRKIYYPYILTAVMTTAMLYMICSLSGNQGLESDTLSFCLTLGVVVTTIFSVVFLFYTNSFLMKRRKKEFGLYNILGMEKKHIGLVVFWETIFILLLSLLVGLGIGILLDKLMFLILSRMLGSIASMSFYVSSTAIIHAGAVLCITFLLIFLNSLRQIHQAKPIELLTGGQVGEREPKANWFIALLGVLSLGLGYYISIYTVNPVMVIFLFFIAVLLVILGTYLLFTAGSVTVLKLLRKNKRYYYRADHFISLSGMIYRMKQNAVGLANVCILCTMVLVMVFSTISLRLGTEDMLNGRIPVDIAIDTAAYESEAELRTAIDRELQKAGLEKSEEKSYLYLDFAGYKQGETYLTDTTADVNEFGDGLTSLFLIPLDSYNQYFGTNEQLEADEILLHSFRGEHSEATLRVFDDTFHIKARVPSHVQSGLMNASIYNTQMLVVKDREVLKALDEKQKLAYGKHSSSIELNVSFMLSGTDEQKAAFSKSLRTAIGEACPNQRYSVDCRVTLRQDLLHLYGGLLFVGLFLGALFIMAMILIIYYKQISEGYDDRERYQIMKKVGLSHSEIKRSIGSQILMVFFLPLLAAGIHVVFSFPSISRMFSTLGMFNIQLMALCAVISFAAFAVLYGIVYLLTAKVYYKIVSE
ncbi:MAG: FtsX-like permease family protein [Clostridia bacterium]